jgi:hypothetical protein
MAKKMGQREAWEYLAKAWKKAVKTNSAATVGDHTFCWGLCESIEQLNRQELIKEGVADKMEGKIDKTQRETEKWGYLWPYARNDIEGEGARAHAKFCRQQAKALERKKATKKGV